MQKNKSCLRCNLSLDEILKAIIKRTKFLRNSVLATDADGVLWKGTLCELFLAHANRHFLTSDLQLLSTAAALNKFQELNEKSPGGGHVWLNNICPANYRSKVVSELVDVFRDKIQLNKSIIECISKLKKQLSVKVIIISASPDWLIKPFIETFNIPHTLLIASDERKVLIGKNKAYELRRRKLIPSIAFGDTMSDKEMLELATDFPIAVISGDNCTIQRRDQLILNKYAVSQNWLVADITEKRI